MGTEGGTPGKRWRKHSPPVVASVVAAVLLAGGGGAYWASTAGGGDSASPPGAAGGTPPPLALDDRGTGGPPGIAVGEPDPNGVRYRAVGKLPDGPRSAPVYLSGREVSQSDVAALAKVLGVPGTPRLVAEVWTVGGAPDTAGPTLQVSRKGPGNWSYSRYGVPGGKPCVHPPGAGPRTKPDAPCPSFRDRPGGSDPAAARPVSEEKAKSAALPVLKAVGQDGAKLDAHRVFGAVRLVTADPVLGSVPTYGWQTGLQIAADGKLAGGGGQLLMPGKGAGYPLISASRALDELNKGAGTGHPAIGGCATAVPLAEGDPRAPAGFPCARRVRQDPVPVRDASFALAQYAVGGRPALVPSWLFTVQVPGTPGTDGTVTVTQPAVDPKYLAGPGSPPAAGGRPSGSPRTTATRVTSYDVDGNKLTLHFWGGVCEDYSASSRQSPAAVTVKVTGTEKEPGRPCVLMAKWFEQEVRLDRALDGRKVVDSATGGTVPKQ